MDMSHANVEALLAAQARAQAAGQQTKPIAQPAAAPMSTLALLLASRPPLTAPTLALGALAVFADAFTSRYQGCWEQARSGRPPTEG
jgi:hypothetical protein